MEQHQSIATPFISLEERTHLVRFCTVMGGRAEVAEDLVQETLLEAWRHEQDLRDPLRRSQWLMGIARNVCLRWLRKQTREEALETITQHEYNETEADQFFVDDYDIGRDLERKELRELLNHALALLPRKTRTALLQHYVNDLPLTEIAQQLRTNTNALAVRLQRGKRALQSYLAQEQEFATLYQNTETWEVTPLWCHHCGKQHLLGKRVPHEGKLLLKCPKCHPGERQFLTRSKLPLLQGMKSYQPMLTKQRDWGHTHFRAALATYFGSGTLVCELCKHPLVVLFAPIAQLPNWLQADLFHWKWFDEANKAKVLNTFCPHCRITSNATLSALVFTLPEARAFAHTHPRIYTLPTQQLEVEGRPALLIRVESITENAVLTIISDEETYRVLRVEQEGH